AHGNAPLNVDEMNLEDGLMSATLTGSGTITKSTDGTVNFSSLPSPNFTGTMKIEDGIVYLPFNFLPTAQFVVDGGQLFVSGDSPLAAHVTLHGGTLGQGSYSGNIDVQTDSAIYQSGIMRLSGKITGSGDLTIRGRQSNPFDEYVGFFGDASGYTGNVRV